jgi:thiol-disulfide isomerase/thioredoxin
MRLFLLASLLFAGAACPAAAGDAPTEEAICRVCEIRGSAHGLEKVAASRDHDGQSYAFCSEKCAEAFDTFPAGYARLPVPRPAPAVALTTLDDRRVPVGSPGGGLLLIDFWATWCKPCLKAMPELEKIHRDYGDDGLTVLGVSIDKTAEAVEKYLEKKPVEYAVALDSGDEPAWHAFSVAAIPAMYLVDGESRIVGEWRGSVDMDDVRRAIEEQLAGARRAPLRR